MTQNAAILKHLLEGKSLTTYDDFRKGKFLITLPEIERFFKFVKKGNGCWIWMGHKDNAQYGRFTIRNVSALLAHVVSYLLHNGPIKNGLHVLHTCDNPSCVNPKHLWLGTHQDNMNDRDKKGRGVIRPTDRGEESNFAKLKDEHVIEIRRCVSLGAKQRDMAKRFGVKDSCVSSIINNKTWKHLKMKSIR